MSDQSPLKLGNPGLRTVAVPMPEHLLGGEELADLLQTLHDAIDATGVLCVAAPEFGFPVRVVVVVDEATGDRVELVNPEVSFRTTDHLRSTEACLSTGDLHGEVDRVALVHIDAFSPGGERLCFDAEGLLAIGIQHATDHLDGVLFVDRCDTRTLAFTEAAEAASTELSEDD